MQTIPTQIDTDDSATSSSVLPSLEPSSFVSTESDTTDIPIVEDATDMFISEDATDMPVVESPPDFPEISSASRERADSMATNIAQSENLDREDLRKMIRYLDALFDELPEKTIREFSRSEYFDLYKKIMTELGI